MRFGIDVGDSIKELTKDIENKEREINVATARSYLKFSKWAERKIIEILYRESGLTKEVIDSNKRSIVKYGKNKLGEYTTIWIGLDGINVGLIGDAEETKEGVKVSGLCVYNDAFIIKRYGGKVYRRKTKNPFPITSVRHNFQKKFISSISVFERNALKKFENIMEEELKNAVN